VTGHRDYDDRRAMGRTGELGGGKMEHFYESWYQHRIRSATKACNIPVTALVNSERDVRSCLKQAGIQYHRYANQRPLRQSVHMQSSYGVVHEAGIFSVSARDPVAFAMSPSQSAYRTRTCYNPWSDDMDRPSWSFSQRQSVKFLRTC